MVATHGLVDPERDGDDDRDDVGEAEQLIYLLLGGAHVGHGGRVLEYPVLGDVQAPADRRFA